MGWREPELLQVPVEGGSLTVARWGSGRRPVLASHGITANHRSFAQVGWALAQLGADICLYAVDHRGRGGSAEVAGPYGLEVHARDLLAVLDHLEVAETVLVGHSMGAYVATIATELAPDRVRGLTLVDGALPIPLDLPPDTPIEAVVHAVIGPALERLDLRLGSPEEHLDRWRAHPAFADHFDDVVEAYVRYDVAEVDGTWRSRVVKEAVLADGAGPLQDETARSALTRIDRPTILLWAPRGLLDQTPGLLPPEVVAAEVAALPHVRERQVADVNHYTIVFSERGARAVADAIVELSEQGSR